jgi:hypothetical protein
MPGIPTHFLLWQKPPGRLNGGNSPQNGQSHPPKGVIRGPNSPQNGPKCRNFKIVQIQDLIARSKNLAKADLMSPPPELSIFPIFESPCFVGSYRVGTVKRSFSSGAPPVATTGFTNVIHIHICWSSN